MRIVCLIFLALVTSASPACKPTEFQWQCRPIKHAKPPVPKTNKCEIIPMEHVCDGKPDCSNRSDEHEIICKDLPCPELTTFKCSYGACVPKRVVCDGKPDCMYGSDEALRTCGDRNLTSKVETPSVSCSDDAQQWQCNNGECIDIRGVCNGTKECFDGSDETTHLCFGEYCAPQAFQCTYGACISKMKRCDSNIDCSEDGSDEQNCPNMERRRCVVEMAAGTIYELDRGKGKREVIEKRTETSNAVYIRCVSPFKPPETGIDTHGNYCNNGKWVPSDDDDPTRLPRCYRNCSLPGFLEDSLSGTCAGLTESGKEEVSCNGAKPGTTMTLSCKENFVIPPKLTNFKTLGKCMKDGKWDIGQFKCIPECGRPIVDHQVVTERALMEGEYPWHVVLYRKIGNRNIAYCSGSIIAPDRVLTAAHCVEEAWNETEGALDTINIGVGRTTVDPNGELTSDKMLKVLRNGKPFPAEYFGKTAHFSADIAVLQLEQNIRFNNYTRPICLDWEQTSFPFIENETNATLVSYGPKGLLVNALRYAQCNRAMQPEVPADKFCAIFNNDRGASVPIERNGGSGFIMRARGYYFLYGILSKQVDPDFRYATFTNVSTRIRWLQRQDTFA